MHSALSLKFLESLKIPKPTMADDVIPTRGYAQWRNFRRPGQKQRSSPLPLPPASSRVLNMQRRRFTENIKGARPL